MGDTPLRLLTGLVALIAAIAAVWLLRAASVVAIPLAVAFFVAITVHPIQVRLHRTFTRARWAAPALTMALLVAVVGGAIWAIAESVDEVSEAAPRYAEPAQQLWRDVEALARDYSLPVPRDVLDSAGTRDRLGALTASTARVAMEIVSGLVLVFFLVLLMLLEAPIWGANTRRLLRHERSRLMLDTVADVASKVRLYLYVRTILGAASAATAGAWLLLLDVDLVLVWVVLTFALNYIPNLGSIVAVIPPALMATLQHGPMHGAIVLGGLAVFEQIIGNFIEPRMEGRRLQVSPVVVLVALVFWSWMWGPVGALLAVPMTVTLLAAAAQVPALAPLATLAAAEREVAPPRRDGDLQARRPRRAG